MLGTLDAVSVSGYWADCAFCAFCAVGMMWVQGPRNRAGTQEPPSREEGLFAKGG